MAWLSRNNFAPSDYIHADDLNNLANDDRTWGGNVNGGGYTLSNVTLEGVQLLGSGQVTSVFGRSGDVIAEPGDYTAAQVGAVPITRNVNAGAGLLGGGQLNQDVTLTAQVISVFGRTGPVILTPADITGATGVLNSRRINTGTGLTGGGNLNADLTLSVTPDSVNQQVQVLGPPSATLAGTRHAINFVAGTYMAISAVDNQGANRVDVTISSTIVPGMGDPTTTLGDLIVRGSGVTTRLPVGSNGQILYADSTQPLGVKWALPPGANPVTSVFGRTGDVVAVAGDYSAAMVTHAVDSTGSYPDPPWLPSLSWWKILNPPNFLINVLTTKGDIPVQVSATAQGRLPVGSDGSILTADSSTTLGVKWAAVPLALVTSVFGRTGAVVATTGDYSVGQVTGAVPNTLVVGTGNSNVTGLSGGGALTGNLNLTVVPDTINQRVQVNQGGNAVGTRHAINFIVGANMAISVQDNMATNCVDVAIASNGGGSGLADPTTTIGDLIVRGIGSVERLPVGASGAVLTADSSQPLGMKWVQPIAGGGQTPWVGDVNAAGFKLNNTGSIGVNANSNPSVARIYVVPAASEDGLAVASAVTTAFASAGVSNDTGASLHIRSYGSAYPTDPGIASIEATAALKFLASGGEVMRLHSGHLLIGTSADDNTEMVQVNGKVKSLAGGFVFPDGTVQTTAFTAGASAVTSVFGRNGAVVAATGDYDIAQVTHGVSSLGSYADPAWITSLSWGKLSGVPSNVGLWQLGTGNAIYYNNGNVGIGTASPGVGSPNPTRTYLTVSGSTGLGVLEFLTNLADGDNAGVGQIAWTDRNSTAADKRVALIYTFLSGSTVNNRGGAMAFYTKADGGSSTERMRLDNTGRLGIGTTSPACALHVQSSSPDGVQLVLCQDAANTYSIGRLGSTGFLTFAGYQASFSGYDFATTTSSGTVHALTIVNSGNVGIGTASPLNLLTVRDGSGSGTENQLLLQASTDSGVFGLLVGKNTSGAAVNVYHGPNWAHVVNAQNAPLVFGTNNALRMMIDATGNVGIGTTNPSQLLTVAGTPNILASFTGTGSGNTAIAVNSGGGHNCSYCWQNAGASQWYLGNVSSNNALILLNSDVNGNAQVLTILQSGNIGIGASTPSYPLQISSYTSGAPTVTYGGTGAMFGLNVPGNAELAFGWLGAAPYGYWIQCRNGGALPLSLNPAGGNVGIGTTNPGGTLHVNGGGAIIELTDSLSGGATMYLNSRLANTAGLVAVQASGNIAMAPGNQQVAVFTTSGNVGIGTPNPQSQFCIIPPANPTNQWGVPLTIGESSNNPNYRLQIGYYVPSSSWGGVIDAVAGGGGAALMLNPTGGQVGIGVWPDQALTVQGRVHSTSGGFQFPDNTVQTTAASGTAGITQITWQTQSTNLVTWGVGSWNLNISGSGQTSIGDSVAGNTLTYTIYSSSDARAKQNIETLTGGLEIIAQIRPIRAEWNGALGKTKGEKLVSVIAQEVEPILPEAVCRVRTKLRRDDEAETDVLGLEPMAITAHLILAVQQLQARIEELEKRRN